MRWIAYSICFLHDWKAGVLLLLLILVMQQQQQQEEKFRKKYDFFK